MADYLPVAQRRENYPLATQAPVVAARQPESEADGNNVLAIAWQSRWLILLCTVVGGAASWAYLQRVVPRYTSTARVYVETKLPQLLTGEVGLGGISSKLNTQVELIRSTKVLRAAVESPDLASIASFKGVENRVGFVRECLFAGVGEFDDIINVSVELPDPEDASRIANAVVNAYIEKYAERRSTTIADVLEILRDEKKRRDAELDERRKKLEQFRAEHVALAVQMSGDNNVVTELFGAFASELNRTQIELLEAKTRYERARAMLEQPSQRPFLAQLAKAEKEARGGDRLEAQIQGVEQQLIAERSKWGEGYPAVKLLTESLQRLRERQTKEQAETLTAYVDTLRQNYQLTAQRRDELQRAYDAQFELATEVSGQAAKLASYEEAYDRTAKMCDILDDRIKEVNLSEKAGAMNVDVIESASLGQQTYPDRPKTLSIGLMLGALVGFGLGWLRDLLDHRLKSTDEIAAALQLPITGAIPLLTGVDRSEGGRVVAKMPRSVAAESVRTLRTSLHFGVAGPDSRIYVVTSPAPGDGKSTVASNLAIAMSQADQKVLLIDGDMRKPTQHQIFEVEAGAGLSSVLTGSLSALEAIVPTGVASLDLLPCGRRPSNPAELLANGMLDETLQALLEHYDRIVIDSPPVMAVTDSRLISPRVDCTLLVLRAERSTRRLSVAARDELLNVGTQRLGIVVNAAPSKRNGYGYGGGYGYGYGAYGQTTYGYGDEEDHDSANGDGRRRRRQDVLEEPVSTLE
ncbi:MAG: polysaccharide biosynthesis tyrosine autokinase [Planctomycetota bacterium]